MDMVIYGMVNDPRYLKVVEESKDNPPLFIHRDLWFNPLIIKSGDEDYIPSEIKELISKWRLEAALIKDDFPYIKYAKERFIYKNLYYELYYSALNVSEVQMDRYFETMEEDLKNIGCLYYCYDGMLD